MLFCHSDVLYKISTNSAFVECQTGRAELKAVKAQHLEAMIECMYTQKYKSVPGSDIPWRDTDYTALIDFDMAVLILADQYNVGTLMREVSDHIKRGLNKYRQDNAEKFAFLVNKISDNEDLPACLLEYAVIVASESLESLYSADPARLLETRPDFAMSVLNSLVTERGQYVERENRRLAERQRHGW